MSKTKINNLKLNEINNLSIPPVLLETLQSIDFPVEFLDVALIIAMGARKHGKDTWLDKDNKSMEALNNLSSCARHNCLAHFGDPIDKESGMHHHLHAATRHLMKYTRWKRGIDK